MRIARTLSVTLLLLFVGAAGGRAQVPGIDVEIVPRIGGYVPLGELSEADPALEVEPGLAFGLGVRLDFPLFPIDLRANVDYATGADFVPFNEAVPVSNGNPELSLLTVVGDVIIHPLPIPIVSPYFVAGAGLKRYMPNFDGVNLESAEDIFNDPENDFTLHAGAGVDVDLGPLSLVAEVSDYISWFAPPGDGGGGGEEETELQNDIFATVGIRIGVF